MDARQTRLGSPDRFGYEWATYNTILPESRTQLERWLGSTGLSHFAGKTVMDVGCGMGRNPYWMAKAGARSVLAVDVDEQSLAAARANLRDLPNVRVEKCSVYELNPDVQGRFECVSCIGVLHHLSRPELALQKMWMCVAPGGDLVLWVYGREGNRLLLPLIQALRALGSRLPLEITRLLAKIITWVSWPLILWWPWRTSYYASLKKLSRRNVESIVFDQMLPRIAHYWTGDELRRLLEPIGAAATIEQVQGNSWHVRMRKGANPA